MVSTFAMIGAVVSTLNIRLTPHATAGITRRNGIINWSNLRNVIIIDGTARVHHSFVIGDNFYVHTEPITEAVA